MRHTFISCIARRIHRHRRLVSIAVSFHHYLVSLPFLPYPSGYEPKTFQLFALSLIGYQAYDMSKMLILNLTPNRTNKELSTAELAAAGFLSAVPTTLVTAPVERAKVLLQVCSLCDLTENLSCKLEFP